MATTTDVQSFDAFPDDDDTSAPPKPPVATNATGFVSSAAGFVSSVAGFVSSAAGFVSTNETDGERLGKETVAASQGVERAALKAQLREALEAGDAERTQALLFEIERLGGSECVAAAERIKTIKPDGRTSVRVVRIQELAEVEGRSSYSRSAPDMKAQWKQKRCQCGYGKECSCEVLTYMENCAANQPAYHANAMFSAFLRAYNSHEDILLAPDDVWLLVVLHFSKYVNDNAEKLRGRFVSHEGKKKLTVTTWNQTSESQWEEFLELMKAAVAANTKGGIVDVLQSDFSTTGLVERMISTAAVMDSFKKYFSYGRCIPCCGIRNACFMGTRADWTSVLERARKLEAYDIDGAWSKYVRGVCAILTQFVATYDGKVDVAWWNKVMDAEHGRLGSGSTTYYTGWLLHLFGKYSRCESDDIGAYSVDVAVKIDNKLKGGEKKTVHLIGGFGGLHAVTIDGRKAYRPQSSMIVFHDPHHANDQADAEEHFR